MCDNAKQQVSTLLTENGVFSPPPPFSSSEPCSTEGVVHNLFDMAQQVHYPSNPLQPGPMYFLTPRKCALFGVCCEAIPRQINYLIDEAFDTGKGQTPSLASYTIFSKCMALESVRSTCMQTTVWAKIKIIPCCSICYGGQQLAYTQRLPSPF